jgi:hypothetical protein
MTDYRARGLPAYAVGLIEASAASDIVTGDGTLWIETDSNGQQVNAVHGGDLLVVPSEGLMVPIKSVDSATQLTLEWDLADAIAPDTAYRIIRLSQSPVGIALRALQVLEDRGAELVATTGEGISLRMVGGVPTLSYRPNAEAAYVDVVRVGAASGGLTSPAGGIGYAAGAGGSVTQATSKATGVTINKATGQIVTNNAALAANTAVSFTVTNSQVAATDVPLIVHASGGTAGAYDVVISAVAAGSFLVTIRNMTGSSLSQALTLNFAIIKGVAA